MPEFRVACGFNIIMIFQDNSPAYMWHASCCKFIAGQLLKNFFEGLCERSEAISFFN